MTITISEQYNDGLLPDIVLLTQGYYHRGTRLNAMKRFCLFFVAYRMKQPHLTHLIMYYIDFALFMFGVPAWRLM